MKHLRSIFETSDSSNKIENDEQEIIDICKDILIDLKDDFPTIEVKTVLLDTYYLFEIFPNIKTDLSYHSLQFIEDRINFIKSVFDSCKRMEAAINLEVKIADIFGGLDKILDKIHIYIPRLISK